MTTRYGFIIVNDRSYISVDGDYKAYSFVNSGSLSMIAGVNYLDCTPSSEPSLLFIRPSSSGYCLWIGYHKSGIYFDKFMILSSTSQTIQYAIFRPGNVVDITPGSYGFVVYNSSGAVVFSSLDRYPKVLNTYTVEQPSTYDHGETYSFFLAAVNTSYFLFYSAWRYAYASSGTQILTNYYASMRKASSTTLAFKAIPYFQRSTPGIGNIVMTKVLVAPNFNLVQIGTP